MEKAKLILEEYAQTTSHIMMKPKSSAVSLATTTISIKLGKANLYTPFNIYINHRHIRIRMIPIEIVKCLHVTA